MSSHPAEPAEQPSNGRRDFVAGLLLASAATFVLWFTRELEFGMANMLGPGFMPRVAAGMLAALGLVLVFRSLTRQDEPIEGGSWRAIVCVSASLCAFAATVRAVGLFPAGTLLCIISSLAAPPVRLGPLLIYAIVTAAIVCVIFKYMLGVQLPAIALPGRSGF